MRLYTTDHGIAREDEPGVLSILDLPEPDLGALLWGRGLDAASGAAVIRQVPLDEVGQAAEILYRLARAG